MLIQRDIKLIQERIIEFEKLSRKEKELLRRENNILDAAEEIFACEGYENTTMNEIAQKAEFSKRTLYQYFENKCDLYLSTVLRLYKSLGIYIEELEFTQKIGYEKLKELFYGLYSFYKENKSIFRLIYDVSKVRINTDNPKVNELFQIECSITKTLSSLIELGKKDGSIPEELDTELTSNSLLFLLIGLFNQLTITRDPLSKTIDVPEEKLIQYIFELLHSSLKTVNVK